MATHTLKEERQNYKQLGKFHTPIELVEYMKTYIDIDDYDEVYDPTCGAGNMLSIFPDNIKKYGQDIEQIAVDDARLLPNSFIELGNTLEEDKFKDKKFKVILANPPFSIKYNECEEELKQDERFKDLPCLAPKSKADWMFMAHILHKLDDKGVAVVMEFPGILYRGNREHKIRKWFVDNNYIDKVISVPGNKFPDTTISTVIIVLKKNKTTTDIKFINEHEFTDKDNKGKPNLFLERLVTYDEVVKENYTLSPNTYVMYEAPKEIIDIRAVELEYQDIIVENIRRKLTLSKFIISGLSTDVFKPQEFTKFVKRIKKVIKEVEKLDRIGTMKLGMVEMERDKMEREIIEKGYQTLF